MNKIDIVITFDTEDVFNPAELGWDDVLKNFSDILYSEDIPGHFLVIAQRAALLKQRGRNDIIKAMKRQYIGVHSLAHDSPREFVVAAQNDWQRGLEKVRKMEHDAYNLVAESFDCAPVCVSGHFFSGPPQSFIAAKELNLPYVYGYPALGPMYSINRFCGAMSFPWGFPVEFPAKPYIGGFDIAVADTPDFEKQLQIFEEHVEKLVQFKQPFLLFHPFHPIKTYSHEWIDCVIVPDGKTHPPSTYRQLRQVPLRQPSEMNLIYRNFGRLLQYIKRHPHLNVMTIPEVVKKYSITPDWFSSVDLYAASQKIGMDVADKRLTAFSPPSDIVAEKPFSPAETLVALAAALKVWKNSKQFPERVPRVDILGPMEDPLRICQEHQELPSEKLFHVAGQILEYTESHGHLPANLSLNPGIELGVGVAYKALADLYLYIYLNGQPPSSIALKASPRQPSVGHEIACKYLHDADHFPFTPPNLDTSWLYQMVRLQSWTLAALI